MWINTQRSDTASPNQAVPVEADAQAFLLVVGERYPSSHDRAPPLQSVAEMIAGTSSSGRGELAAARRW
jgi:hypothetical protein